MPTLRFYPLGCFSYLYIIVYEARSEICILSESFFNYLKLSRIHWAPLYYMQFAFTVFQFCNFKLQIVFCFCNLQFGCNLRLQITRRKNGCKYYMQLQIGLFQKILQLSFYGRYILYAAVRLHIPFFCKKEGSY